MEVDEYRLVAVHPNEIRDVWGVLEEWMFKVSDGMGGRENMATLIARITSGEVVLWAIVKDQQVRGVVGTEFVESPTGLRSLVIRYCVGKKLVDWIHLVDVLEDYAVNNGCQKIETWARKGWAKHLPDYRMTHVLLEKEL